MSKDGLDSFLQPEDLESWENQHGRIPNGAVVIVHTGHGRWAFFWNSILMAKVVSQPDSLSWIPKTPWGRGSSFVWFYCNIIQFNKNNTKTNAVPSYNKMKKEIWYKQTRSIRKDSTED